MTSKVILTGEFELEAEGDNSYKLIHAHITNFARNQEAVQNGTPFDDNPNYKLNGRFLVE